MHDTTAHHPRARRRRLAVAASLAVAVAATSTLGLPASAGASPPAVGAASSAGSGAASERTLARALVVPFGLATARGGAVLVAQSGAGVVTRVTRRGAGRAVVRGVPGVAGVASRGRWVWSVIGGPSPDGPPVGGSYGATTLLRTNLTTGRTRVIADLEDYELRRNPDGQVQLVDGQPVDALSNPFSMTLTPRGLLVADGGANAVLRVDPWSGRVSTFFVPPNPRTPACLAADAQANPGTTGCDSVPTGVTFRDGSVWVSTLGSERPGAGRVYRLSDRTGRVQRTWRGLDSPTGVAVSGRAVYYSQVFGDRGVGALQRVDRGRGARTTTASFPQPTGLLFARGRLHASVGSLTPGKGRVVTVPERRFR